MVFFSAGARIAKRNSEQRKRAPLTRPYTRGRGFIALLLWTLLIAMTGAPALAQTPPTDNTAGLVIVDGQEQATTYCVALKEEATGWDLLVGAGVAINSEPTAMGVSVCSINGTGCTSPREACFCQCQGSPCIYWSFWQQDEAGKWLYLNQGASSAQVQPGIVQAWVWGDGTTGKAPEPPAFSYADICRVAPAADLSQTSALTATLAHMTEITESAVVTDTEVAGTAVTEAAPPPDSAETPAPLATADAPSTTGSPLWVSLLVLAPLPIILLLILLRRREKQD